MSDQASRIGKNNSVSIRRYVWTVASSGALPLASSIETAWSHYKRAFHRSCGTKSFTRPGFGRAGGKPLSHIFIRIEHHLLPLQWLEHRHSTRANLLGWRGARGGAGGPVVARLEGFSLRPFFLHKLSTKTQSCRLKLAIQVVVVASVLKI